MLFYASVLLLLALATAGFGYLQSTARGHGSAAGSDDGQRTQADASSIKKFKTSFLVVYCLVTGADWVQGPHIFSLCEFHSAGRTRSVLTSLRRRPR